MCQGFRARLLIGDVTQESLLRHTLYQIATRSLGCIPTIDVPAVLRQLPFIQFVILTHTRRPTSDQIRRVVLLTTRLDAPHPVVYFVNLRSSQVQDCFSANHAHPKSRAAWKYLKYIYIFFFSSILFYSGRATYCSTTVSSIALE